VVTSRQMGGVVLASMASMVVPTIFGNVVSPPRPAMAMVVVFTRRQKCRMKCEAVWGAWRQVDLLSQGLANPTASTAAVRSRKGLWYQWLFLFNGCSYSVAVLVRGGWPSVGCLLG
jgi:hypothetical protein